MIYASVVIASLIVGASAGTVKVPMKKRDNSEFVKGILAKVINYLNINERNIVFTLYTIKFSIRVDINIIKL